MLSPDMRLTRSRRRNYRKRTSWFRIYRPIQTKKVTCMRKLTPRAVGRFLRHFGIRSLLLAVLTGTVFAQTVTDELAGYNDPPSHLRGVIEKFDEDYGILDRYYSARTSPNRS